MRVATSEDEVASDFDRQILKSGNRAYRTRTVML